MVKRLSNYELHQLRILRKRAFLEQRGLCYWCKVEMVLGAPDEDPKQATGDHLIPLFMGGRTIPGNIVAACRVCNNGRHPEMNKIGGGVVASAGDDVAHSPFEALEGLLA